MSEPVDPAPSTPVHEGLRARKKRRTWLTIQEVAFEMFDARGYDATTVEEIAEKAEVSVTTFFRYFPAKDDVIFSDRLDRLPIVRQALLDRPPHEPDVDAARNALQEALRVTGDDPGHVARASRAILGSRVLRGRASQVTEEYATLISAVLAERHGLERPDARCRLAAEVAVTTFGLAVRSWVDDGARGDVHTAIEAMFTLLGDLTALVATASEHR